MQSHNMFALARRYPTVEMAEEEFHRMQNALLRSYRITMDMEHGEKGSLILVVAYEKAAIRAAQEHLLNGTVALVPLGFFGPLVNSHKRNYLPLPLNLFDWRVVVEPLMDSRPEYSFNQPEGAA